MRNILSQIDLAKLLQPSHIFEATPPANGWYVYLTVIFGALILLAIASIWIIKRQNKIYRKLRKGLFIFLMVIGIIGLLLTFFRFEQIPYFASRLLFLLLMMTFILWGGWIGFYVVFILPKEKQKLFEKQKFIKYLPARHTSQLAGVAGRPRPRSGQARKEKF